MFKVRLKFKIAEINSLFSKEKIKDSYLSFKNWEPKITPFSELEDSCNNKPSNGDIITSELQDDSTLKKPKINTNNFYFLFIFIIFNFNIKSNYKKFA